MNEWKKDIIKLAKFLRKEFPAEVAENERKPIFESSAIDLAIELLGYYKARLTQRAADVSACPRCKEVGLRIIDTCVGCGYDYSKRR